MIKSFKHKGLQLFFNTGNTKGIQAQHSKKLKTRLAILNTAVYLDDVDMPGFKLHQLKGTRQDQYSIVVNGNWRLTFEFKNGDVYILNYEDYH